MNRISYDSVFNLFLSLGELSSDNGQDYSCLCHNAVTEVENLLRVSVLSESDVKRLEFLCAVIALEKYVFLKMTNDAILSMKLLDATVNLKPSLSLSSVKDLKLSAFSACSDLIKPLSLVLKMM